MRCPQPGLPWFMTIFGRDSILTSLQSIAFTPELAATTLRILGERQGTRIDDFRDEDPGRILHEMRFGELTAFEERPHSPYYGCADATPLYVVLLDEYERWTGDTKLVRDLEYEARAALRWIDEYADLQGNGYISYQRRNEETGLENQCWKDSWDSISYRDGTLPGFPRATCELQGYAYDAKVRGARLARQVWHDHAFADRLEDEAADLKRRFNRDFWVADGGYFAIALDTDGRQVDALTSNNGHLLWSGIVDKSKARRVVDHLMGDRLFSGWGVRTMAEGEGRFNPIGYHVGTIWPFDNSFIAWGLRRYGFKDEAAHIAEGILDAAKFFDGRLPEAFGGYPRSMTMYPVQYPTACSPQAWSTAAPLLLLRTMLGLEPLDDHLIVDPAIPASLGHMELLDIPGAGAASTPSAGGGSRLHRPGAPRPGPGDGPGRCPVGGCRRCRPGRSADRRHRVVIVGGGFGGLPATRLLGGKPVDVTLIDRRNHHLFQPLLYQTATGMLAPGQIAPALRHVVRRAKNVRVQLAEVTGFDLERKVVHATVAGSMAVEYPYDSLIVAAGVTQSYFGHEEFAFFAPGMKTLDDALELRRRIFGAFEVAELVDRPGRAGALADRRRGRGRADRRRARRSGP